MKHALLLLIAAGSVAGCELILTSPTKVHRDDDGSGGAGATTSSGGATGTGGTIDTGGSGGTGGGPSVGGGGSTSCPGPSEFFWDTPGDLGPWCSDNLDQGGMLGVADGMLQIDAGDFGWWFDGEEGPFVYQTICGSFSLVSRMAAELGPHAHHGIGVVIRSVEEPHDWALFSLGHQESPSAVETKLWTYVDGIQDPTHPGTGDHAAASGKLAVCRSEGGELLFAEHVDGDVPRSYPIAADDFGFGGCVQVGFTVHEWWEPMDDPSAANVRGLVDYAHFLEPVSDAAGCQSVAAWGL